MGIGIDNFLVSRCKFSLDPNEITSPEAQSRNRENIFFEGVERGGEKTEVSNFCPFFKVTQNGCTFQWFQVKQKSLLWNYGESRWFSLSWNFPLKLVYGSTSKNIADRIREQTWTRFTVKWGRKQVRMDFFLALPSFIIKGFQSSNYKSKLEFFHESAFEEEAAIFPFKAFPQPDIWMEKGQFPTFYKVGRDSQLQRIRQLRWPTLKRGMNKLVNSSVWWIHFFSSSNSCGKTPNAKMSFTANRKRCLGPIYDTKMLCGERTDTCRGSSTWFGWKDFGSVRGLMCDVKHIAYLTIILLSLKCSW